MSEVEVRELDKDEYYLWDDLVKKSPQGTVFHETDWLVTCSNVLGEKLQIYGFFNKNDLEGGCAIFINKFKGMLTKANTSCLMTPYFGLIWREENDGKVRKEEKLKKECLEQFSEYLTQQKLNSINIVNSPGFVDLRAFTWNGWETDIRYTYYLYTNNIKKSTDARKNIKKANKNGIIIEKSDDIDEYYNLFKETFFRQGLTPPAPKELISSLYYKLNEKGKAELWTAKTEDGKLAAAEIFVMDSKMPHRWTAATDTELRKTGSYSLLLDEVFTHYKNEGYETINLMAANTPQLSEFITSFNPKLVPYYKVEKSNLMYKIASKSYDMLKGKTC